MLSIENLQLPGGASVLAFAAIGVGVLALVLFFRQRVRFDPASGMVVIKRGSRRTEFHVSQIQSVKITREVRTSGSGKNRSSYTVYPVKLVKLPDVFTVSESRDYFRSRKEAETHAKRGRCDLVDESSSATCVREGKYLDETVRQRYVRTKMGAEIPQKPMLKSQLQQGMDGSAIVDVPPPALTIFSKISMGVFGIMFLMMIMHMFAIIRGGAYALPFVVFPIFFMLPAFFFMRVFFAKTRVEISNTHLAVKRHIVNIGITQNIPLNELEEFLLCLEESMPAMRGVPEHATKLAMQAYTTIRVLNPTRGILARSDRKQVRFAEGLDSDEIRYIHAILLQRIQQTPEIPKGVTRSAA